MNIHKLSIKKFTTNEIIIIDKISQLMNKTVMNKNMYDRWFLLAFKDELEKHWKRRQKKLASEVGVTEGFISDIKNGKNFPSRDTQILISEKMGYENFDDFLSIGKNIEKTDHQNTNTDNNDNNDKSNNNLIKFPINKPFINTRFESMHNNLDAIIASNDDGLIAAIEANLVQFKEISELKKTVSNQSEQLKDQDGKMKLLEDRLKAMEVKSG